MAGKEPHDGRKTRSRSGCLTCRKRKKRCDEVRPICETCERLQLDCEYPLPGEESRNKKRRNDPNVQPEIIAPTALSSVHPDNRYDILSPMFKFEDAFPSETSLMAVPDFSLPTEMMIYEPQSTLSMITLLKKGYPDLGAEDVELFTYFCDTQSQLMSVSPQNNFKHIFANMAISHEPVLYSLLSWAAFHGGDAGTIANGDNIGRAMLAKAINLVSDPYHYKFEVTLASLLLIASAHICAGDMQNWRQYLEIAANVIKKQGVAGIDLNSEELYWIMKNFTYHDILAFGNRKKPLLLPKEIHQMILSHKSDVLPDTLCACCQPVFLIMATINDFCREIHEGHITALAIQSKAHELLDQLDHISPDRELLLPLSYMDAHEQLNLFKVFQQLARVVVHNLLLRLNAASIPMQVMNTTLIETLRASIGSRSEGALVFPLFISGISACTEEARLQVVEWHDTLYERHSARNISRSKALMREVWARDEHGTKHVDWNQLAEIKGWNLSFA